MLIITKKRPATRRRPIKKHSFKGHSGFSHRPPTNVITYTDKVILQMAIPGIKKEAVEISIADNRIDFGYKGLKETREGLFRLREFTPEAFHRSFLLDETIDQARIEATYDQGILSVIMPIKKEAQPQPIRKIDIQ